MYRYFGQRNTNLETRVKRFLQAAEPVDGDRTSGSASIDNNFRTLAFRDS